MFLKSFPSQPNHYQPLHGGSAWHSQTTTFYRPAGRYLRYFTLRHPIREANFCQRGLKGVMDL